MNCHQNLIASVTLAVLPLLGMASCGGTEPPAPLAITTVETPAAGNSTLPHLARGPDGQIALSWIERADQVATLRFSLLQDARWSAPRTVAQGSDWFVNWADFPSVVPLGQGRMGAHWLQKRPGGTYAYDVVTATSVDHGQTFAAPVTPHTDGTATEHGFVSLYPHATGVGALWLDGRNTAGGSHADHDTPAQEGGMTLRSVVLTGAPPAAADVVDDLVCDCCQTDVAITDDGPVAVYRDRTRAEIRDIFAARFTDGRWQPPVRVGADDWHIAGCPVNGPAIDADGQNVVVAWFTQAGDQPRVRVAFSADGARTFATPIDVDTQAALGRVDITLLADGGAAVSWLRQAQGAAQAQVSVRRIDPDGFSGPIRTVADTAAARSSGFPQMVRNNTRLVFAWADVRAVPPKVRTATADVAALSPSR